MTDEEFVCPVCGDEYEPEYENREDAPPLSIGREQHQTGICSDECWDEFMPMADGGTEQDSDVLAVGVLAEDREQTRDERDPVVIVNHPGTVAHKHRIHASGRTVHSHNQRYGYSPVAAVVQAVYVADMDAAADEWREEDPDDYAEIARNCGVSVYSWPAPRLSRAEEERGEQ